MFLLKLLGDSTVIGIGQLLVGKFLKGKEGFSNVLIPIATFLVAVLGLQVLPTAAHAAALIPGGIVTDLLLAALFQTHAITGAHSLFKNTVIPVAKWAVLWAAKKIVKSG